MFGEVKLDIFSTEKHLKYKNKNQKQLLVRIAIQWQAKKFLEEEVNTAQIEKKDKKALNANYPRKERLER